MAKVIKAMPYAGSLGLSPLLLSVLGSVLGSVSVAVVRAPLSSLNSGGQSGLHAPVRQHVPAHCKSPAHLSALCRSSTVIDALIESKAEKHIGPAMTQVFAWALGQSLPHNTMQ